MNFLEISLFALVIELITLYSTIRFQRTPEGQKYKELCYIAVIILGLFTISSCVISAYFFHIQR